MLVFFAVLSLVAGLYFFHCNLVLGIIFSIVFIIFLFISFGWKTALPLFLIFSGGVLLSKIYIPCNPSDSIYSGIVVETKENYFLFQSKFEKFYVYESGNNREIGDILNIKGKTNDINFVTCESQFNFNSYLEDKGVKRALTSNSIENVFSSPFRFKNVKQKFIEKFDSETGPIIDSLLFNNKDYSNYSIKTASNLNVIHLFSMSGIYLHFIVKILVYILSLKFDEKFSTLIAILFLFPYTLFAFPKIGVMRVFLTLVFTLLNKTLLKGKLNSLTRLSILALIFLTIDFHLAYDSGFLIGFGVSAIINIFNVSLKHKKKALRVIGIPLLIFLLLLPMTVFQKGSFLPLTPIFQTLLLPITQIFSLLAILTFYGIPMYSLLNGYSSFIRFLLQIFDKANFAIPFYNLGEIYTYVYIFIILFCLYLFECKRNRHLKYALMSLVGMLEIAMIPIHSMMKNAVYFINVGQGDCIIIQNHLNAVMIDTGGNLSFDMAEESLIPFMNKHHIRKLDALITTHDDFDHSGAVESLINNFNVKKYIKERNDFPVSIGAIYLENLNQYSMGDENDKSLVLKTKFLNKTFLFTGDASIETEKWMIENNKDLDCDILKIGHHGSITSTSDEFLNKTSPYEAIISVGANNKYHHPSNEVLDKLKQRGIKIRRTDIEGTISYVSYFA